MQDRSGMVSTSNMTIRLLIQVFVVTFVLAFSGILLHWGGVFSTSMWVADSEKVPQEEVFQSFDGVVLSMREVRFNHTQQVLQSLGINVIHKVPPSFESKEVDQKLEAYVGSREYHTPVHKKVWSNRMAFIDVLETFVLDPASKEHTWRFFFEDDIQTHPSLSPEQAKSALASGLRVADADGFVFLGICGPTCAEVQDLNKNVQAARCFGTCAHAFGFQQWKAAEFLTEMSGLTLVDDVTHVPALILGFFFDRYLFAYGQLVHKIWVIGSNLKSPVSNVYDHFGLLYQDRTLFHSEISQ